MSAPALRGEFRGADRFALAWGRPAAMDAPPAIGELGLRPVREAKASPIQARRGMGSRLSILSVVHAGGGGTILTNEDLMSALARRHSCFVLACGPCKWELFAAGARDARLERIEFSEPWRGAGPPARDRLAAFAELVARRDFDIVHVRSILGAGPEIVPIAREAGCAVVVSFHDYLALCPTIQLLDADLNFCAGRCTSGARDCGAPAKWFDGIERLKHMYVHAWRRRVRESLRAADAFVTTSKAAASLLSAHFDFLTAETLRVIEHGRDLVWRRQSAPPGVRTRVAAMNVSSDAKGAGLVRDLIARNRAAGRPFEFHLFGGGDWRLDEADGIVHGAYARDALPARLAAIRPSFSLIPSLWPETYSHTLTESWAAGIPVLASDCGALRERVRERGGGCLLDPRDAASWFAMLTSARENPNLWREKADEIARMRPRTVALMAADYERLYRKTLSARGVAHSTESADAFA